MISILRASLDSWIVRGFFMVLVLSFGLWGVGDVLNFGGSSSWVAKVGDRAIEPAQLDQAYRREMTQVTRMLPAGQDPSTEIRRAAARQALDRLISQNALATEVTRLHLEVPEEALRQAIYEMPGFRGPSGKFERSAFEAALRNNGLNEPRFLDLLRGDLGQKQLMEAVRAGAAVPKIQADLAFAQQSEQRSADLAEFPLPDPASAPEVAAAVLQRWYDNHPDLYSSPEYRKIKAVILSPEVLGKDIEVSDEDLRAEFERSKASLAKPATRSVQVILVQDKAKAEALAAAWRTGANWNAMQAKATEAGGSAIEMTDATKGEFPSPELASAVFAAEPGTVPPPEESPFGWQVLKVGKAVPGIIADFETLKSELHDRVAAAKAANLIYDRANKIDNILAGGATLDELPGDLGIAAISGTMDAAGKTREGEPAPIPGGATVRAALIAAAFSAHPGDPPSLTEVTLPGGGSAYYALQVEEVTPPAVRPYESVREAVAADVARDEVHKQAERTASGMLAALKGGQSFADAATVAGVAVHRTPLFSLGAPEDVAPEVVRTVFDMKKDEPGMVETPAGFTVLMPVEIVSPAPKADPAGYDRIQAVLTRSIGDDLEQAFVGALRQRAGVKVNESVLNNFIQP